MDTTKAASNTITEYKITREALHGEDPTVHRYDLMTAVMVCLGDQSNHDGTALHEMLSVLLSDKIRPQKKADILNQQFDIPMTKGEVEDMCNLSDLIAERAIAEGMERGMAEGMEKGMEKGKELALLDSIRSIMRTLHLSVDQALSALQIPEEEWSFYKNQMK